MILRCCNFVTLFTVCNLKLDAPAAQLDSIIDAAAILIFVCPVI